MRRRLDRCHRRGAKQPGQAYLLYGVAAPVALTRVVLIAVGAPLLASGYSEPEGVREVQVLDNRALSARFDPRDTLQLTW